MDSRLRQSVRRRGGRAELGRGPERTVQRARVAVLGQSVQPGKRGVERHDAATEGFQAGRPAGQDRRRHRRPGQDIGFHEQRVRMIVAVKTPARFSVFFFFF